MKLKHQRYMNLNRSTLSHIDTTLLHVASLKRYSFVKERTSLEFFVFTPAVRTCESSPGNAFVTRPNSQRHLGTFQPPWTAKFLFFRSHLWRCCNVGIYSPIHRDLKQFTKNCACLHCVNIALLWRRHEGVDEVSSMEKMDKWCDYLRLTWLLRRP